MTRKEFISLVVAQRAREVLGGPSINPVLARKAKMTPKEVQGLPSSCIASSVEYEIAKTGQRRIFITVLNWTPKTLNELLGVHHMERSKLKKVDRGVLGFTVHLLQIPKATGRRRVSLQLILPHGFRRPDRDAWWKSVLDALVHAGMLRDDSPRWCVPGDVNYRWSDKPATRITLEELDPE